MPTKASLDVQTEPVCFVSPLVTFPQALHLAGGVLGETRFERLLATDERAPKPMYGGGSGSKRIYSRAAIIAYLEKLAVDGFPDLDSITQHTSQVVATPLQKSKRSRRPASRRASAR
jgi:hypothetical protein